MNDDSYLLTAEAAAKVRELAASLVTNPAEEAP
jgi:hypothetical protein